MYAQAGSQADEGGEEEHKGPIGQGKGHHGESVDGNREGKGGLSIRFLKGAKRCMADEEELQEEERAGIVAFVVADLAPELYVELLDALRL